MSVPSAQHPVCAAQRVQPRATGPRRAAAADTHRGDRPDEHDRRVYLAEQYISQKKELTKQLLRASGIPVPEGRPVSGPEDAWRAAREIGLPVVVKPLNGNHGRGVFTDLRRREDIEAVFPKALAEGDGVLVERCARGAEHRVLVVGNGVVAVARGEIAYVTGDGRRTVAELVEELNRDPRRGDEDDCPLARIEFESTTTALVRSQGFEPDSIPPAGRRVMLQRNGNLSIDVTDDIHPEVARCAVLAARVVSLDVAGIDMVTENIGRPLREQGGAIIEVNAGPGLQMHLQPSEGRPRPVGEAIVEHLFPCETGGRIPIVAVLGEADLGEAAIGPVIEPLLSSAFSAWPAQAARASTASRWPTATLRLPRRCDAF